MNLYSPYLRRRRMDRPHYSVVVPPECEPLSYAQAADHLRVDSSDDMGYIQGLIAVAREHVESVTGRVASPANLLLTGCSWESLMRGSNHLLRIGRSPVITVESINYYTPDDPALTEMPSTDYRVVAVAEPAMVQHIEGYWPEVDDRPDAIQIEFIAGHSSDNPAPAGYLHAIKMLVAHLYENRVPVNIGNIVNEIPYTLQFLIEQQRVEGRFA